MVDCVLSKKKGNRKRKEKRKRIKGSVVLGGEGIEFFFCGSVLVTLVS